MSVIGPLPEVERSVLHYTLEQRRLLDQTPGLAGLSALVYPDESELLREFPDPEQGYLQHLMPRKVAIDLQYESCRTFWSDLRLLEEIAIYSTLGKSYRMDHNLRLTSSEKTDLKVEGKRTAS